MDPTNTMQAVRFHDYGGPEVLKLETLAVPEPKPGEALVRVKKAGVNYVDVYQRRGILPVSRPSTVGVEGVGVIERANGNLKVGTRVAWISHPGSCAEYQAVPEWKLVPIPDDLDEASAAAAMLQGVTAQYLCETTYPVKRGDTALVHAGAGGVGLLLIQLLKHKGATVLTTVSTPEKAALALQAGADETILYTSSDFVAAVRSATAGAGVDVAYDSVGLATYAGSLSLIRPLGMLVLFGQSSGLVPPIDPLALSRQGSIFLTRPALGHYVADEASIKERATRVLDWVQDGTLKIRVERIYPLEAVVRAHADLEARKTTGKLLIDIGQ
jgi:NADPH2:quinone reductase